MTTPDPWTERLSEVLDGELDAGERDALDAHLAACPRCREALESLRAVVSSAGRLGDRPPAADLWPGIAARIDVRPSAARTARRPGIAGRFRFLRPRLAMAVLVLALSGGALWIARSARVASGPPPTAASRTAATMGNPARLVADRGTVGYDAAIADLERVLADGRDRLDPATVQVLERNLGIIDRAIEDARRAVAADPGKRYLNRHLVDNMQRKFELLRRATLIVRAQS